MAKVPTRVEILSKGPGQQIACLLTSIDQAKAIAMEEREQFC